MEVTYACTHCDHVVRQTVAVSGDSSAGESHEDPRATEHRPTDGSGLEGTALGNGDGASVTCSHCGTAKRLRLESDGRMTSCGICGGGELYVRKDFSQRMGVAIVVAGFVLSSVAWYFYWVYATFAILFATALIDVVMYLCVGNMLQCYRCQAEYRGVPGLEEHSPFRLETHERYRQQAARLPPA